MGAMHTFSARARIAPCTHPQAAPVERCQTARFRPSAARASRALPSAAYAAVARCRARTILERHTSTPTPCPPSWSRTGRYSARRRSSAERCVALLRVHRTPPDQDVLGAVKRMLYVYWLKVIKRWARTFPYIGGARQGVGGARARRPKTRHLAHLHRRRARVCLAWGDLGRLRRPTISV